MINSTAGFGKSNSLMSEYSALVGEAILRYRARAAEQSARIESELAGRVKSEFIANMSHELRTPLNTIMGFSKLLGEHEGRPLPDIDIVQYSHLIHDAAGQLLAIINDILDISKMQSGRYTLDHREISLDETLDACVAAFKPIANDAQVTLVAHQGASLGGVRGDTGKLRQIFSNLIGNAIKFTLPGGTVTVEASRSPDGGNTVLIHDTGVGMSEDEIALAMTPFGQVDGTRARWREGAGLGLPIAKALVELHGGRLEVRSTKGVGTLLTITLPSRHVVSVPHGRSTDLFAAALQQ